MPVEKLVIYIALAAIFFVKFVLDSLKRQRESQTAQRAEPDGQELGERWWDPLDEPAEREVRLAAEPRPAVVPPPRPARTPAAARPAAPPPAARARRQALVQPALQHKKTLGNRAELRRAVELMAILGPPRSLAPYEES
jgi:hypothetical protein